MPAPHEYFDSTTKMSSHNPTTYRVARNIMVSHVSLFSKTPFLDTRSTKS